MTISLNIVSSKFPFPNISFLSLTKYTGFTEFLKDGKGVRFISPDVQEGKSDQKTLHRNFLTLFLP